MQLRPRVAIARAGGDRDPALIGLARPLDLAQLFICLPTVEVGRRVVRIGGDHRFKGRRRPLKIATILVLHGYAIQRQHVLWILRKHRLQSFKPVHLRSSVTSRVSIPFKVACPYFVPVEPWSETGEPWPGPRRVPLGEPYRGNCQVAAGGIDLNRQASTCNFGYARHRCPHFPKSDLDAIRFSITGNAGDRVELVWIEERDHAPVSHGTARYRQGVFEPALPAQYLTLALAFVRTYLNGKSPQGIAQ